MTQEEQVYEYIQEHNGITTMEAISKLGCTRLSAYIFNLRKKGHVILTEPIEKVNSHTGNKTRFVRYYIEKD